MSEESREEPKLQSLAQAARGKQLNTARGIMFFVGVLTVAVNAYQFFSLDGELQALRNQGMMIDEQKLLMVKALIIAGIAVGAIFVVFGFLVKSFPIPITVIALVLYIGTNLVFGVVNPQSLAAGAIVKIIIIVAMIKSIQAAIAYNNEMKLEADRAALQYE